MRKLAYVIISNTDKMGTYKPHIHTPPHLFRANAIYMITGSTYKQKYLLTQNAKKQNFCDVLFARANQFEWLLMSWAIMDNHYHFIAQAPEKVETLSKFIQAVHSLNAIFVNKSDGIIGRKVWYNYWDTCITNETSYLARLRYVNENPVKHGIVASPEDYLFCSYRWVNESFDADFLMRIFSQPIDRIKIKDDF